VNFKANAVRPRSLDYARDEVKGRDVPDGGQAISLHFGWDEVMGGNVPDTEQTRSLHFGRDEVMGGGSGYRKNEILRSTAFRSG
jgi:hypothetical protein